MSELFCERGRRNCLAELKAATEAALNQTFTETAAQAIWNRLRANLATEIETVFDYWLEQAIDAADSYAEDRANEAADSVESDSFDQGREEGLNQGREEGLEEGRRLATVKCPSCEQNLIENRALQSFTCSGCRREFQLTEAFVVNRP